LSNPLNNVDTGARPTHPDAQGKISNPFKSSVLPPLRHAALDRGVAGNTAIIRPLAVQPNSTPPQKDIGSRREH
jgi:hypothetical protein